MQKGQTHAVGTQYAGVSAKMSIHTVDLANMGGWDRYLLCTVYLLHPLCELTFLH